MMGLDLTNFGESFNCVFLCGRRTNAPFFLFPRFKEMIHHVVGGYKNTAVKGEFRKREAVERFTKKTDRFHFKTEKKLFVNFTRKFSFSILSFH